MPCNKLFIFPEECLDCSASFLISSATTEKPLPASPALAVTLIKLAVEFISSIETTALSRSAPKLLTNALMLINSLV
nr:hypothetical protein [Clostridium estertheticum]